MNAWNRPLELQELEGFHNCKPEIFHSDPNVINWENHKLLNSGITIKGIMVSVDKICPNQKDLKEKLQLFAFNENYNESKLMCHQFGGEIPLPSGHSFFQNLFKTDFTKKLFKSTCSSAVWVPVVRSQFDSEIWMSDVATTTTTSSQESKVTFLPWEWGQPNGYPRQNCITAFYDFPNTTYWDSECQNTERCFLCIFHGEVVFHLRGPCFENVKIDRVYMLRIDLIDDNIFILQGFAGRSEYD